MKVDSPFFLGDFMPIYTLKNTETEEVFEVNMKISEKEEYLKENPHMKQLIVKAPAYGDPVHLGIKRIDSNFRDVLQKAKSAHLHSTVEF
jgi:hypothetical protein